MKAYMKANFLSYRIRDSASVSVYNKAIAKLKKKRREPVPDSMVFGTRTYRCTHGLYQPSRGKGARAAKVTRYTACGARIVVQARRSASPSGQWIVQAVTEVVRHNHNCSQRIADSYNQKMAVIARDEDLFNDLHLMIISNSPTARIRDVIRMRHGVSLTAQDIRNFMRDRLGGRTALANLRLLLQRFSSFEGSRCLIIEDEDGLVCGIVLQSLAQRMMFERYGDNLLLDWTHNTNNAGYYLGSLMATSASGSGVSVLDFLCLAQTKDMMRTVFTHFIAWNPGAVNKIRSFVIDKDYAEWMILKELFPQSRVLFCQFHVVKWLIQVVQEGKYGRLPVPVQHSLIQLLRDMVYAETPEVFRSQKWLLEQLLGVECPAFIAYMVDCWYSCSDMWADCERGTVFTATNTTNNRLESAWGQVKSILGLKLRFDMCAEALWTYATGVFEREIRCFKTVTGPTSLLRSTSDRFMRPVLCQVSDYCADLVEKQYAAHLRMIGNCVITQDPDAEDRLIIEKFTASGSHRVVSTTDWSCTCREFVTSELPCRHVIFVSRVYFRHEFLPLAALRSRWMLSAAVSMLPQLEKCTTELQSLRTGLLLVDPKSLVPASVPTGGDEDDTMDEDLAFFSISSKSKSKRQSASVAHVRLARGEAAAGVVLDNLEKRNVVMSEFQPLMTFMMAQSSALLVLLSLDALLDAFKGIPLTEQDRMEEAISAAMAGCELSPEDQIRRMVESSFDHNTNPARRPQQDNNEERGIQPFELSPVGGATQRIETAAARGTTQMIEAAAIREEGSPELQSFEDEDDVSSLSISCASTILQNAALHQACEASVSTANKSSSAARPNHPLLPFEPTRNAASPAPRGPPPPKRSAAVADLDTGVLEKVILRVPLSAGRSKTQRARGKLKGTRRTTHVTQRSDCSVELNDLVRAARLTRGVGDLYTKLGEYPLLFDDEWLQKRLVVVETQYIQPSGWTTNFVIPAALVDRFDVAIKAARLEAPAAITVDLNAPPSSDQFVAKIDPAVRGFCEGNVATFQTFYKILKSCAAFNLDIAWIRSCKGALPEAVCDKVTTAMLDCALDSRFHLRETNDNTPTSIALSDMVGHLARDSWLTDTVLVFVMRQIADEINGVLVMDSLRPAVRDGTPLFSLPSQSLARNQLIVFPVNLWKSHWCLICVAFDVNTGVRVTLYDPKARQSNVDALREEWVARCEPFVSAWCTRDTGKHLVYSLEVLTTPRQAADDGNNCGIYCIATACDFAMGSTRFRSMDSLTPELIGLLRLNFMRSILVGSVASPLEDEEWAASIVQKLVSSSKTTLR